ncbi:MAG: class I SAM-dependent methyltransferase [Acidobacteriota bacterium]
MSGAVLHAALPGLLRACCPVCEEETARRMICLDFLRDFPAGMWLVRCLGCGCQRIDPHPLPERMARHYDLDYYREGYTRFMESRRAGCRLRLASLRQMEPVRRAYAAGRPPRCLDVGAGIGLFVAEALRAGWQAQGMEPSSAARQVARQVLGMELHGGWPAAGIQFDLVTLWDVLGHVEDPADLLGRIRNCLPEGGGLVIKVPNFQSSWHWVRTAMSRLRRANLLHAPTVIWRFHRAGLWILLERTGFAVESLKTVEEKDLIPLSPRWKAVRLGSRLLDALLDNRQEMIFHARAC